MRLGTFQLSDLCYNTLGGAIGGVLYWMGWKVKKVFISHRRIDGEEIAALIYDKIKIQEEKLKIFRDVAKVNVGDEAQTEIDEVMKNSEIFIFIHTGKAAESDWILKELRFALLRNIPILWVQIDGADVKKLRIKPSDQPHLSYSSEDFEKEETLTEIIDEILQKSISLPWWKN